MQNYHIPVLVEEVVAFMAVKPGGLYVDATFGGGGHTRALLEADATCKVIAFDWDVAAFEHNRETIETLYPGRVEFVWASFSQIALQLKKRGIKAVDGILADFGTSQYQIKHKEGFSFLTDSPLDMRMSPGHQHTTAAHILNETSEKDLMSIFWEYGQELQARAITRAIIAARTKRPFRTSSQLAELVVSVVGAQRGKTHPATRVFQALRMVVNRELDNIRALLTQSLDLIKPNGHIVCISFHSLEDRLVKQFFVEHKQLLKNLTPRVIIATGDELQRNSSARSAKLRAAEKI